MSASLVIVIGGGAAGMMAAGRAAECGVSVLLLEKTPRLGNKLRLTGKGRCNVTNQAELTDLIAHFGATGRFLYSSLSHFSVQDLRTFLHQRGVATTVERGGRVFPTSDDARQVAAALEGYLVANSVQVRLKSPVEQLLVQDQFICGVQVKGHIIPGSAVILATGGASYPRTGSSGDGYRLAAGLGHHIVPIRPALIPLVVQERWASSLQGLSLQNVQASLLLDNKPLAQAFGEMLFTHFGVSGPIILTLSKHAVDALPKGHVTLSLNLKSALTPEELDQRLRHELEQSGRKQLHNALATLLPAKMISTFATLLQIPADKPSHQVTASERKRLLTLLQDLRMTIVGSRPLEEAIITAGGVDVSEIDPRTMQSKLVHGLFFCGEVIDMDADTGGYNLQAAFSTGHLAGESAACTLGFKSLASF